MIEAVSYTQLVKALEVLSDAEFLDKENVQGILTSVATRTITSHRGLMQKLLSETCLLYTSHRV